MYRAEVTTIVRRRRTLLPALIAALLVFSLFIPLSFSALGRWLVVEDPLQPASAVVVFGGHLPFRAMEAAKVYHAGWVSEVWITQPPIHAEEKMLTQLGVEIVPEHEYSRQVLEHLGVPEHSIRLLSGEVIDTAEEVRRIADEMRQNGSHQVILITSKSHTRRVRVLWHKLAGARQQAIVRYTSDDPFDAARWWGNTQDAMAVSREVFGLLNAWAGFPIKATR